MIIGIDFDDVLFSFAEAFCAYSKDRFGSSVVRDDIHHFGMEIAWQCTPEEMVRRVHGFYVSKEHSEALPISGSVAAVKSLSQNHELHVITSRSDHQEAWLTAWIEQNFGKAFKSVRFTNQFPGDAKRQTTKSAVCKELGVDVFIDDALHHAEDAASAVKQIYLLDAPWNQPKVMKGQLPTNVKRINGWKDALDEIENVN